MTFVHMAALAIAVLVAAPLLAHLLRRKQSDVRDFPAARLVPPSPPLARRRRQVDDRLLYAIRTTSVLALAFLGATPFVRCSGLTVGRPSGASIALAIVLDDSLTMQARQGGTTRWARARDAAADLVRNAREGDAIAIVLAGASPRIALASTTDLGAARAALNALKPSHRATDLGGALELARALVDGLPQTDRRVVLLSDLADGHPEEEPLQGSAQVPLWVPLEDLAGPMHDCAVVHADRRPGHVAARVACSDPNASAGRALEVRGASGVVATVPLRPSGATSWDLTLDVADGAADLVAGLTGADAIPEDDVAPVLVSSGPMTIGIVADPVSGKLPTGGAPAVEQALTALDRGVRVKPLPLVPEHAEELTAYAGLVIEDAAGFTPETRRALASWVERGGVAFVALGPRAALVSLGASFEPLLQGPVSWGPSPVPGLDDKTAGFLGTTLSALTDVHPQGRATLDAASLAPPAKVVAQWKDGAPWLVERTVGRGLVFVTTLPTSPDVSDLPLRPAFLALVDAFVSATRARTGVHRTDVGQPWAFDAVRAVEAVGPGGEHMAVTQDAGRKVIVPERLGRYQVLLDGDKLVRVAAPNEREVDFRPRSVAASARASALGDVRSRVDLSPFLAVALLALLTVELGFRLWVYRTTAPAASNTH